MMTKKRRGIFQFAISLFLVVQIFISYVAAVSPAQAQGLLNGPLNTNKPATVNAPKYDKGVDKSIESYLCVPSDKDLGIALYTCISKMYRFGIAFGAVALVFFLVFAGYMYITGGETGKQKGKSIFTSALTGMAIILSSYLLLGFINPELTRIKPIQPPIFTADGLPSCADVGLGEKCVLPDGQVGTGTGSGGGVGVGKCESRTGANGLTCKAGCSRKDTAKCVHTYDTEIAAAVAATGVDRDIIRAVIQTESTWNPGSTSRVGAKGLMQLMAGAIKDSGCSNLDINVPANNIMCGAKYWKIIQNNYLKKVAPEAANNLRHIAAAYNGGSGNGHFSKSPCGDLYNYECPFTTSAKTVCKTPQPNEMTNYAVTVEEYYNQYKSGSCN